MRINKKLLAIGGLLLAIVVLPVIVFYQQQQTQTSTEAQQTTTMFFSPDTTQTPVQKAPQENFAFDIMINPGQNLVTFVKIDMSFDPTKIGYDGTSAFALNTAAFPEIVEGPIYGSNKFTVTVSIGNDPTRSVGTTTRIGTINLRALAATGATPTQLTFTTQSQVLSSASTDQASENVLAGTSPARILIVAPTPTISCNATGGNGGSAVAGPGVTVRGGDGGTGGLVNGVCTPGTNGYNVNAGSYCTNGAIAISWPTTNTATYYKLLIDGAVVQNGSGLSYNATGYSRGVQHNITLYAGNSSIGDFNPSTGGYFTISTTACPTPTLTNTPTLTPTRTPTPTLTNTPTPTRTPTPVPPTPTRTPTPTPLPTNTPVPTSTPIPQGVSVSFTAFLHGIGSSGDSKNPTDNTLSNKTPLHPSRQVVVEVYNAQEVKVGESTGTITYNAVNGNFQGGVDFGTSVTGGTYLVKVKTDQYLKKQFTGIQTLIAGQQANPLPTVTLVAGDANNDNALDIRDYNLILGCYSDLLPARACNPQLKLQTDINDDGNVNQNDYNLFLREMSVQSGD